MARWYLEVLEKKLKIIDSQFGERGARSDEDWVTYIDSNNKEHIKEHLNIQLDFKAQSNNLFEKMMDIAKPNKYPTERNRRIFEVAKELFFNHGYSPMAATSKAIELVEEVGIETE